MKKSLWVLMLSVLLGLGTMTVGAAEVGMQIDGVAVSGECAPLVEEGTTLVPLKIIAESLGAQVGYDEQTKTVVVKAQDTQIVLQIENKDIWVNENMKTLLVAPRIVNNVAMVPLRIIAEELGCKVAWDQAAQQVIIRTQRTDGVEQLLATSRFIGILKDAGGVDYQLAIQAADEQITVDDNGDTICTGTYKFYYYPEGTTLVKEYIPAELAIDRTGRFSFNLSKGPVRIVRGTENTTLLMISEPITEDNSKVHMYRIEQGVLERVTFVTAVADAETMEMWSGKSVWIRHVGADLFESVWYNRMKGEFYLSVLAYDLLNGKLVHVADAAQTFTVEEFREYGR